MRLLIIFIFLVAGVGIYLNRAYAYFYDYHGIHFITPPRGSNEYVITRNEKAKDYSFFVLGDSLTAGVGADTIEESYPHLLAEHLSKQDLRVRLKNLATPGVNTVDVLNDQAVQVAESADLAIVLTGTNDIHNKISASVFESNLSKIIDILKQKKSKKIFLVTIPYLGSDDTLLFPLNALLTLRINQFNGIIERLSSQKQTELIDLNGLTSEIKNDPKYYAKDKFHPSSYGYKKWSEVIINASRDKLP